MISHTNFGLMNFIYYMLIKTGLPPIIFMGVGALTDFGPMLRNLRLSISRRRGSIGNLHGAFGSDLDVIHTKEAASLVLSVAPMARTAIFTTIKLAPHLLGPIAIAAYSYMALRLSSRYRCLLCSSC